MKLQALSKFKNLILRGLIKLELLRAIRAIRVCKSYFEEVIGRDKIISAIKSHKRYWNHNVQDKGSFFSASFST